MKFVLAELEINFKTTQVEICTYGSVNGNAHELFSKQNNIPYKTFLCLISKIMYTFLLETGIMVDGKNIKN